MNALWYAEALQSGLWRPDIMKVAVEITDKHIRRFELRFYGDRILIQPVFGGDRSLIISQDDIVAWTPKEMVTYTDDPFRLSVFASPFFPALNLLYTIANAVSRAAGGRRVESGTGDVTLNIELFLEGDEKHTVREDLNSKFLYGVFR